jgi:hypothetical protein
LHLEVVLRRVRATTLGEVILRIIFLLYLHMMISLIKLLLLEILPPIEALYCFIYRDIF